MHNLGGTKTIHFCRSTDLSNDQWIYSRTTKRCIVVQLKRVATRLCKPGIGIPPSTLGNPSRFFSEESSTFAGVNKIMTEHSLKGAQDYNFQKQYRL